MLKIKKKDMAVLIAATALVVISLLVRDTIAQRMLYLCAMVVRVSVLVMYFPSTLGVESTRFCCTAL